jgi:hypothetical protein
MAEMTNYFVASAPQRVEFRTQSSNNKATRQRLNVRVAQHFIMRGGLMVRFEQFRGQPRSCVRRCPLPAGARIQALATESEPRTQGLCSDRRVRARSGLRATARVALT